MQVHNARRSSNASSSMESWVVGMLLREKELQQSEKAADTAPNLESERDNLVNPYMNRYDCWKRPECPPPPCFPPPCCLPSCFPPPCCPPPPKKKAYGYFSHSSAAAGTFTAGSFPFNYFSDVNKNVALFATDNKRIVIQEAGDYEITFDIIASAAVADGAAEILLNGGVVQQSVHPIIAGSFGRTILLKLAEGDTLQLAVTKDFTQPAGINASIYLEKVS